MYTQISYFSLRNLCIPVDLQLMTIITGNASCALNWISTFFLLLFGAVQGRIQDFKLGRAHLKKLRGVFCVKNHDFTPKNHMFSNFRGGGGGGWIRPCSSYTANFKFYIKCIVNKTPTLMSCSSDCISDI